MQKHAEPLALTGLGGCSPENHASHIFKMKMKQGDENKKGQLSLTEGMSIYANTSVAQQNYTFWEVDKGVLRKDDKYMQQARHLGKKP